MDLERDLYMAIVGCEQEKAREIITAHPWLLWDGILRDSLETPAHYFESLGGTEALSFMLNIIRQQPAHLQSELYKKTFLRGNDMNESVLFRVCSNLEHLKFLVDNADDGVEILNAENYSEQNLAHAAALSGTIECLDYIVQHCELGANILEARDSEGRTPAFLAVERANRDDFTEALDILKYILDHSPHGKWELEVRDDDGNSFAHEAATGKDTRLLEFLIENCPSGTNILETINNDGLTPAHMAERFKSQDCLKFIIDHAPHRDETLKLTISTKQ